MIELFDSAYLWADSNTTTPPVGYDSFSETITLNQNDSISCAVPALAGDTASFTVAFDGTDPDAFLSISDASNTGEEVFYSDTPQDYVYVVKATSSPGLFSPLVISLTSTGSAALTLRSTIYPTRRPVELFNDPMNWMDENGNSPPSQYNAATGKYTFDGNGNGTLYCTQGSLTGDTVTLDASAASNALNPSLEITDHISTDSQWGIPHHIALRTSGFAAARQLQIITTQTFQEGSVFPITLAPVAAPVSPPRKLELCYSKDGGHTFSPWRQADLGNQGDFNARALFRRLGLGRRVVLRIRYSGDSTRDVVQASVDTSPFP